MPESAVQHQRELILLFVAYHPSADEVARLRSCLAVLPDGIGYAVAVNDHSPGEAVEALEAGSDIFLPYSDNPGYGRAINRLLRKISPSPAFYCVMNTDLAWQPDCFSTLLAWMHAHPDVVLATPQILDSNGAIQRLCKRDPTVLGLFSRRFVPSWLRPDWLKRYDRWFVMLEKDYSTVFDVSYLSGCCMMVRADALLAVGGFDERFFLYLEDADITRLLRRWGRCVHLPVASVTHAWGRGSYQSLRLMIVNLHSAWKYFNKWGWKLW
jgi:GT2 family glycosyltransferase